MNAGVGARLWADGAPTPVYPENGATMTEYAEPERIEDAALAWSNAVLTCRLNGHAWRASTVVHNNRGYTIRQRCTRRCGCEREMLMDGNGYVVKPWQLHYPSEGYLLEKHTGRVSQDGKARMRIVSLRHLSVIEGEDE